MQRRHFIASPLLTLALPNLGHAKTEFFGCSTVWPDPTIWPDASILSSVVKGSAYAYAELADLSLFMLTVFDNNRTEAHFDTVDQYLLRTRRPVSDLTYVN